MNRLEKASILLACLAAGWATHAHAQKGWPRNGTTTPNRIMASPLAVDMNSDGRLEVMVPRLDDYLYVYRHDGTPLPGSWPYDMDFTDGTISAPAYGNIDGVGVTEIVIVGDNGSDASATVVIRKADGSGSSRLTLNSAGSASGKSSPCLIDCYKYDENHMPHPGLEIVVRDGDGQVHIVRWNNGTLLDLFESSSNTFKTVYSDSLRDRYGSQPVTPSVSAREISETTTYLVAPSTDGKVYHWEIVSNLTTPFSATKLTAFSASASDERFYGSAVISELDEDGVIWVIAASTGGRLYVWRKSDRASRTGFPKDVGSPVTSSPCLADLNADGEDEILVGDSDGYVHAWHLTGSAVTGWPQQATGDIQGPPLVADIDSSTGLEVVVTTLSGQIMAWSAGGQPLDGWPKRLGTPVLSPPLIADIHQGGRYSILVGGFDGQLFCFDVEHRYQITSGSHLMFQGDVRRSGYRP